MSKASVPLHTQVPQDLYNAVEDLAKRMSVPKSFIVRASLVQYIKAKNQVGSAIELDDLNFEE